MSPSLLFRKTLAVTLLLVLGSNSIGLSADTILIQENYDAAVVGSGTYTGPWKFIFADTVYNTGTLNTLSINDGSLTSYYDGVLVDPSPQGGNHLYLSVHDQWAGQSSSLTNLIHTTDPLRSPLGHFYRMEMLDQGKTYNVKVMRSISKILSFPAFSVWDGNGLDLVNPYLYSSGNLLARQAYTGGWQSVDLTFTAPGTLGSGTTPIYFTMGDYEPMTHPDPSIPESEYDNNFSTVDPSFLEPVSLYYIRSLEVIYALDNFILTELSGSTFIPEITATPDAATFPEGSGGVISVLTNDTFSGSQAHTGNVSVSLTGVITLTGVSINTGGQMIIPSGTNSGIYTVNYEICEIGNPTNCSSAPVTITIIFTPLPDITARADTGTFLRTNTGTLPLLPNDTYSGSEASTGTVTISLTGTNTLSGSFIDPVTGNLILPPSSVTGTFVLTYQICDRVNPTNCSSAPITITLTEPALPEITATPDAATFPEGSGGVISVLTNDTFSGSQAHTGNVSVSLTGVITLTGVSINTGGQMVVPSGVSSGSYTVYYQICDRVNTSNCSSAPVSITIVPPSVPTLPDITARADTGSFLRTETGSIPVLSNDTYSGSQANTGTVIMTLTGVISLTGSFIDPTSGRMIIPPSSMTGTFVLTYQICDRVNPTNCSSAPVTVNITDTTSTPPVIPPASGGGGGGIPTTPITPTIPQTTPTVPPTFTPPVACVSAIKNLDDPRLIAYYDDLSVIGERNPDRRLTRVEFLKLIVNARKGDLSSTPLTHLFPDVRSGSWYNPYVSYALAHALITGDQGNFRPNDIITRAEASKIFINALGAKPVITGVVFADVDANDGLAPYIEAAYRSCLVHGRHTIDGEPLPGQPRVFEPSDSISLGETAKVLYNAGH